MRKKYNPKIVSFAQSLRNDMTKEERRLWYDFLSNYHVKFVRQKVLGVFVADFYCAKANLVIELDGSQHFSEEGECYDKKRTAFLNAYGIRVLRFSNADVNNNFYGVCTHIDEVVTKLLHI